MPSLYKPLRPALFCLDPETAHGLSIKALKSGLVPAPPRLHYMPLEQKIWNLHFPNPIGLAAGFDKNAEVIGPTFKLGFSFTEVGTVTPRPQPGNPKPRVFRDADSNSIINRMGFPSAGMHAFKSNLERSLSKKMRPRGVVGINIGMNKDQTEPAKDYATLIRMLAPMADYITINISSPNTPGLRDLQKRDSLLALYDVITKERAKACGSDMAPPILLKLAPDLEEDQQVELAEAVMESGIEGLVLTNTTLNRPKQLPAEFSNETGGLSGALLRKKSKKIIGNFYILTKGKIPIIGVGGISSGQDAFEKIKAGASLVQIYSGFAFEGPSVVYYVNKELVELLRANGYSHIGEAIGADHRS